MEIEKGRAEQIERWASYIKSVPREVWRKGFNEFINAQFEMSEKFYKNLEKSEEGRKILERLKKERLRKRRG